MLATLSALDTAELARAVAESWAVEATLRAEETELAREVALLAAVAATLLADEAMDFPIDW